MKPRPIVRAIFVAACACACAGASVAATTAAAQVVTPADSVSPPAHLLGRFSDDYGSRYEISRTEWKQGSGARYHILRWNIAERYLIAQNDSANPGDGGLWTRIDWVELSGMPPYQWAYCYSAYNSPSAAVADTVSLANRAEPRTGCNGFPFSRMQPASLP
ncbi:MAG: hypothetical protein O2973_07430 [Gemmatimonadetes bacterium]|nr:hypothetical protein [Gemmatimonadota bacterium]